MAITGPITIHNAESTASGLAKTINLRSVNGSGYAAYEGCAIGGVWTAGVVTPIDFTSSSITATTDIISVPSHGGLTGDKAQVTTTGTVPKGLSLLTDYWVIKVGDGQFKLAASLTDAIAGTAVDIVDEEHTLTPVTASAKSFTDANINAGTEEITINLHGFVDGQLVTVSTDGTLPTGLPAGDSWVIVVNANTIKLASSLANASAGTARDISADGAGNHTLTPPTVSAKTFTDFGTDPSADTVSIVSHTYHDGLKVALTTSGTLPGGLAAGDYFVIVDTADTIKLASSLALAAAGTADDITDAAGFGTHTLTGVASAGTASLEHSIDGTTWMTVPSAFGGSSQDTAAVSQYIWSYTGKCSFIRLNLAPTGGRLTGVTIKIDTPRWAD